MKAPKGEGKGPDTKEVDDTLHQAVSAYLVISNTLEGQLVPRVNKRQLILIKGVNTN